MNTLHVTSSPHVLGKESTRSLMREVVIALMPALVGSIYLFGYRSLVLTAICVASCVIFEYGYCRFMKRESTTTDMSGVVTGILLAFNLPVTAPLWMPVVGAFFAIVIVKMLFGGIGQNVMNPALAARVFLAASWATEMTGWIKPVLNPAAWVTADAVTTATPLSALKSGVLPQTLNRTANMANQLLGARAGCLGETSALLLLAGGLYLLFRKVITWETPVGYILTVAVIAYFAPGGLDSTMSLFYNVFGGGLMLGALFMATDYVTSPLTGRGRLFYGVGCGLITMFIRKYGAFAEGVSYSILIMNVMVWFIDKATKPARFGGEVKA